MRKLEILRRTYSWNIVCLKEKTGIKGATRGIGKDLALKYAENGANIALISL
jgi:hypothetical protein